MLKVKKNNERFEKQNAGKRTLTEHTFKKLR